MATDSCKRGISITLSGIFACQGSDDSDNNTILLAPNEWSFIAVTYDQAAKTAAIYVNGQYIESPNYAAIGTIGNIRIGSIGEDSAGFVGLVDDLFIYAAVLSKDDLDFLSTAPPGQLISSAGSAGTAVHLDGFGLIVPDHPALDSFMEFSFAMWLKIDESIPHTGDSVLLEKSSDTGVEYRLAMYQDNSLGQFRLHVLLGHSHLDENFNLSSNTFRENAWMIDWTTSLMPISTASDWFHLAVTWDGAVLSTFVDGAQKDAIEFVSPLGALPYYEGALAIGSSMFKYPLMDWRPCVSFKGYMDSLSVWNRSISINVHELYALSSHYPRGRNLVAFFSFNEGYGLIAHSSVSDTELIATWSPLVSADRLQAGHLRWVPSSAPLADVVVMDSDSAVSVLLNGTASLTNCYQVA